MNERLKEFLFDLAQKSATAELWYPSTVGSLDEADFSEDLEELHGLEDDGLLKLSHLDERRRGVRVELTVPEGREWAAGLK